MPEAATMTSGTATPAPPASTTLTTEAAAAVVPPASAPAAAAPAPVVPDKYDLKLPENSPFDATTLERTAAISRELGLSQDAAQKTLEFMNQEATAQRAAALEAYQPGGAEWVKQEAEWSAAAAKDELLAPTPEKFQANIGLAKQVLKRFGDEPMIDFLEKTGLGSHPATIRLLVKIGQTMSEGSLVIAPSPSTGKRTPEEILYGGGQPKT